MCVLFDFYVYLNYTSYYTVFANTGFSHWNHFQIYNTHRVFLPWYYDNKSVNFYLSIIYQHFLLRCDRTNYCTGRINFTISWVQCTFSIKMYMHKWRISSESRNTLTTNRFHYIGWYSKNNVYNTWSNRKDVEYNL